MRVALTGASGFTGRYVTDALTDAGIDWVSLEADLTDGDAIAAEIDRSDFDRLIHLGARAFVNQRDWSAFYDVNQLGTYRLLEAVAHKRPGTRCILASSAQVYGPGAEGLITEDAPTRPANHYAVSKTAMELGAELWRGELDIVVTRPFNYTGVGQAVDYLIPKIVDHFARRADVIELGNLWVKRDFGDVRAVAKAYVGLVDDIKTPPSLVNVATATLSSIDDVLSTMIELSGHTPEIRVNPAFVRPNDVPALGGDTGRLRAALPDWRPYALRETLAWMYQTAADGASNSSRQKT